jgi:hypothetical protein
MKQRTLIGATASIVARERAFTPLDPWSALDDHRSHAKSRRIGVAS